jgi:hypothetical protein
MTTKNNVFERTFVKNIQNKIYNKNENVLLIFVGEPRVGKSLCAIKLLKKIDPTFNLKDRCAFELEKVKEMLTDEKITNCAIMIEELGVKIGKRDFAKRVNKALIKVFQVWAYRSICCCFTVPSMSEVDSALQRYVTYEFYGVKATKRRKMIDGKPKSFLVKTKFKVRKYQHNASVGKTYIKVPVFMIDGVNTEIPEAVIPAPDEKTIEEYLSYSLPYKKDITDELMEKLINEEAKERNLEVKKEKAEVTADDVVKYVIEHDEDPWRIGYKKIRRKYGFPHDKCRDAAAKLKEMAREKENNNKENTKNPIGVVGGETGV